MGRFASSCFLLALALPGAANAQCRNVEDGFVADVSRALYQADRMWWPGRPLRDGRNAHRTNTVEEWNKAFKSDANWFEGDVRVEINHSDRLEMRHDTVHESGDNLTLAEWLAKGKPTGRGLKLDIKETALMPLLLDQVEQAGIPDGRLMFNLGDSGMAKWGAEIRRRFPNAILAINPTTHLGPLSSDGEKPLADWQIDRALALAAKFGGPTTFVLNEGQASPHAVDRLQTVAPVSIWGDVEDPAKRSAQLRAEGVDGMIDLAKPHGLTPVDVAESALNHARTWWDRNF